MKVASKIVYGILSAGVVFAFGLFIGAQSSRKEGKQENDSESGRTRLLSPARDAAGVKNDGIAQVVDAFAGVSENDAVAQIVATLDDTEHKLFDMTTRYFVETALRKDPDAAKAWAERITNPDLRAEADMLLKNVQ